MQGLTPLVNEVRKPLVSLDIGQHNALEIFALKSIMFLETSKDLLNDAFAEFDGSSWMKNSITDRLNLGELQVDNISANFMAEIRKKFIAIR